MMGKVTDVFLNGRVGNVIFRPDIRRMFKYKTHCCPYVFNYGQ
jgi:hypothetical protein